MAASPADAEKPDRGCADSFKKSDLDDVKRIVLKEDPEADPGRLESFFQSYDKNEDGYLCTKGHPHVINPVDNTSNH